MMKMKKRLPQLRWPKCNPRVRLLLVDKRRTSSRRGHSKNLFRHRNPRPLKAHPTKAKRDSNSRRADRRVLKADKKVLKVGKRALKVDRRVSRAVTNARDNTFWPKYFACSGYLLSIFLALLNGEAVKQSCPVPVSHPNPLHRWGVTLFKFE